MKTVDRVREEGDGGEVIVVLGGGEEIEVGGTDEVPDGGEDASGGAAGTGMLLVEV